MLQDIHRIPGVGGALQYNILVNGNIDTGGCPTTPGVVQEDIQDELSRSSFAATADN